MSYSTDLCCSEVCKAQYEEAAATKIAVEWGCPTPAKKRNEVASQFVSRPALQGLPSPKTEARLFGRQNECILDISVCKPWLPQNKS